MVHINFILDSLLISSENNPKGILLMKSLYDTYVETAELESQSYNLLCP